MIFRTVPDEGEIPGAGCGVWRRAHLATRFWCSNRFHRRFPAKRRKRVNQKFLRVKSKAYV